MNAQALCYSCARIENDQFTCRTAETLEEAKDLVEAGFKYVTDMDDRKLFRKPK
jgi:hypothetical protein